MYEDMVKFEPIYLKSKEKYERSKKIIIWFGVLIIYSLFVSTNIL